MPEDGLYIGIMSGTSVDGVDAALVDISATHCSLIGSASATYSSELRGALLALNDNPVISLPDLITLDLQVARAFADCALALLKETSHSVTAEKVIAIGSHGQTIFHQPDAALAGTLQIGDPNTIAKLTSIDVVADFRRADMANGGQGAPLVPAFHQHVLSGDSPRVILNLGGIANISILDNTVTGFDTGPANTLLDAWCQQSTGKAFDRNGDWSRSGEVQQDVLTTMLGDPFFSRYPPKSTGKDYFNMAWLNTLCNTSAYRPQDIQATLLELTARTVADAISNFAAKNSSVYVCGGGARNTFLMERLATLLAPGKVSLTNSLGVDSDACEAIAFAWLAHRHKSGLPGNLPEVTGAQKQVVLGGLYPG